MNRAPLLVVACAWLASACARPAFDVTSIDARTLRDVAPTEHGPLAMHAIAFPPRATTHPKRLPLVVVEPVLWKRELLLRPDGLVSWLVDAGFPVWLVGADADVPPDAHTSAIGVARAITTAAHAANVDRVDVLGLGFGGPAALFALEALASPASPVRVRRVAFLGASFDSAREPTFLSHVASMRGGPAIGMCTLDDATLCDRALRDRAAVAWLGALPPVDATEHDPSRVRFPFVTRFVDLPVLFVVGKRDGIAPSESVFPLFALWGSDARDPRAVPKSFFLAGRENGFVDDLDAFELLAGGQPAVWERIERFLGAD